MRCYLHGITVLCDLLYESRTKSAVDLLRSYINPAIALAQRLSVNLNASAYATLAKYCDAQFTALDAYLTSSEFAARRNFLKQAQKNVVDLSNLGEQSRLLRLLQRQSALEDIELTALKKDADHFLEAAVDAYAKSLPLSDDHDLTIFRLISLWLSANSSPYPERRENVNKVLSEQLTKIEAHKFLPLVPQLVARLSTNSEGESSFQTILTKLIIRIVDMHPHHSAFAILFLINAELDYFYSQTPKSSGRQLPNPTNSSKVYKQQINEASVGSSCRKTAALKVFDQLCRGRRGELLRQMQRLAQAYIDLANTKVDKYKTNADSIPLPTGCELYRLISLGSHSSHRAGDFQLGLVTVPTCNVPIDRSGHYPDSKATRIAGFSPKFRLVGGINSPILISCLGTDGKIYRQLVKGNDDPRQDAVMQQVFTAANLLLGQYEKISSGASLQCSTSLINVPKYRGNWLYVNNGLCIRTYKVVPVSQRCGVIEWCEGTVPLGEWLANERSGAHQRYRPRDMFPNQAKQRLAAVRDKGIDVKLAVYSEICEKTKPVLAYFFLEQFSNPADWCKARLAYTRSLAVTSVVGYLVGLGDRHPHNILLHKSSGELVHIDFGVAFDQGRLLPTPETVPFRLTRDLVHALGPLGLQTGFIPAAEAVLRKLREGSNVILTLLQVLLYDPLYSWSLTPAQLCALEAKRAEINATLDKSKSHFPVNDQCTNISRSMNKENIGMNVPSAANSSHCQQDDSETREKVIVTVFKAIIVSVELSKLTATANQISISLHYR
ncbi:unnamed protein product [Heterobilharzia americana]|nr:unnamed protein product [Heterobilharzia americana]